MISNGQQLLVEYLVALTTVKPVIDAHPVWANGLELDIFYPEFDLAIEFQGHQHFSPVFGRREFKIQRYNDRQKVIFCEQNGVLLVRIQTAELKHPLIPDILLRRFMQCYGGEHGSKRFFQIAGENPISRQELVAFNARFRDYRLGQIVKHASKSAASNAQERRLLKRAMARRVA